FQALREAAGRLAQRETLEPSRAEISQRVRQLVGLPPAPTAAAPASPPSSQVSVGVGPVYAPEPAAAASRYRPAAAAAAFDDEDVAPPQGPPRPSLLQQLQDFQRSRRYQQPGQSWQGSRPKGPRIAVVAAAGAVILLLLLVAVPAMVRLAQGAGQGSNAAAQTRQQAQEQPRPTQAPAKPSPTPTTQPRQQLAGAVTGFQLTPQDGCAGTGRCTIRVQVNLQAPQQPTDVTWSLQVTDLCHGNQMTTTRQEPVTAQRGWTYVYGIDSITLPSGKVQVVAQTTTPATATSDPLSIGNGC
ncbi:MAG: hypothetical protein J2P45_23525, partial [Candidatus Dormibacteraeota bacterium]|nr:hypothetical protein [Candidatus Dormibacteraeota bacterium]